MLGKDAEPAHMQDFVHTSANSGGAHTDSGIPDRAFRLAALALGGFARKRTGRI